MKSFHIYPQHKNIRRNFCFKQELRPECFILYFFFIISTRSCDNHLFRRNNNSTFCGSRTIKHLFYHRFKSIDNLIFSNILCCSFYLISLPSIISLSTVRTERLFSSSAAARIIPCDSTPQSLQGFKFVTTATFFPTISSGL